MTTDKAPDAFRTISEAAEDLDLPQHVLRFWETRFTQIKPLKRGGGRRLLPARPILSSCAGSSTCCMPNATRSRASRRSSRTRA